MGFEPAGLPEGSRLGGQSHPRRYALIIPACNEEESLPWVLRELREVLPEGLCEVFVGVNGSSDGTARVAELHGAKSRQISDRGYGFGCLAAVALAEESGSVFDGYLFLAADGANDPRDITALVSAHQAGAGLVLGSRTLDPFNRQFLPFHYRWANRFFGFFCGLLTGRFFSDLGPLRIIDRRVFGALALSEGTYGWTIEAQVRAARLGVKIVEVSVKERRRVAGEQKVSHVSWMRTWSVGLQILAAGVRARFGS